MAQHTPRKMSASAIAEEAMIIGEIKKAEQWMVCLVHGPFDRRKREGLADFAAAWAAKEELDADSKFGRRAVIYAVNKLGSFPVDLGLAKRAGLVPECFEPKGRR